MNIGNVLLLTSLIVSFLMLFFLARSASGNRFALVTSRQLYLLTSITITFAVIMLFFYLINHDYRYLYVYENSSNDLSLEYVIAAFWAGKEGSFLLWLFILNIMGIIVMRTEDTDENILLSVITITQIFILVVLVLQSPFRHIWDAHPDVFQKNQLPPDGAGLNPLLIDPWMVVHPPVLFLGYASSTIPFGYAVAALLRKDYSSWIDRSRGWILFSMTSLGIGIFLGGYWAYKVLGWGGYWGWDPVENSSLIPWLVAVALMHGILLQKRRGALVKGNLVLALSYFILVFYSTFLTRSGILADFSVHSFAAHGLSIYLVSFIVFYILIAVLLLARNWRHIEAAGLEDRIWRWDNLLVYGILILIAYDAVILVGTSMPIISGVFTDKPTAVTVNFYNNFSVPFGSLILVTITLASIILSGRRFFGISNIIAIASAAVLGILFNVMFTKNPAAYIFSVLALFLLFNAVVDLYKLKSVRALPSRLAHIGVGIMVLGIISSNMHSTSVQKQLVQGTESSFGPYSIQFNGMNKGEPSSLSFTVKKGNKTFEAETEYSFNQRTESIYREPYIRKGLVQDLYLAPDNYQSGLESATTAVIRKGQKKQVGDLSVQFTGFDTRDMATSEPTIYANLIVNGVKVRPGLRIIRGSSLQIDATVPGTHRTLSILQINVGEKVILVNISPDKGTAIPPDRVLVEVSFKRLIWLVWLGVVLISFGGLAAFYISRRNAS